MCSVFMYEHFFQRFCQIQHNNIVYAQLFFNNHIRMHWNVLHLMSILFNFNWFYWIYIRISFFFALIRLFRSLRCYHSFAICCLLALCIKYVHHYQANYRLENCAALSTVLSCGNLMCKILYKERKTYNHTNYMLQLLGNCTRAKVSVYVFVCIHVCLQTMPLTNWTTKLCLPMENWNDIALFWFRFRFRRRWRWRKMRCSFAYLQKFYEIDLVCAVCRFIQTWRLLLLLPPTDVVSEFLYRLTSVFAHEKEKEEKPALTHKYTHSNTLRKCCSVVF